jgi:hypothetical protein
VLTGDERRKQVKVGRMLFAVALSPLIMQVRVPLCTSDCAEVPASQ